MQHARRPRSLSWLCALVLSFSGAAHAESSLRLEWPAAMGKIPATTYDEKRVAVGASEVEMKRLENGNLSVSLETPIEGGASTAMAALFEPMQDTERLRPVYQRSRSLNEAREPLGMLEIDHRTGVARCHGPDGKPKGELQLPEADRVANATLNLLFLPLVRQETDTIEFQLFFCGLGMRLVDFEARRAPEGSDNPLVEVRYAPDLGIANLLAPAFLPKLSFWFAAQAPHRWMAHRVPLYGRGPEVFVVRDGVPVNWLSDR